MVGNNPALCCGVYPCEIDTIIDGSTFIVWMHMGFDIRVRKKVKLVNIKCHDVHVPKGLETKKFVSDLIGDRRVYVETFEDRFRKYATILAVIYIQWTDKQYVNLNDLLIEKAMAYFVKDAEAGGANAP